MRPALKVEDFLFDTNCKLKFLAHAVHELWSSRESVYDSDVIFGAKRLLFEACEDIESARSALLQKAETINKSNIIRMGKRTAGGAA